MARHWQLQYGPRPPLSESVAPARQPELETHHRLGRAAAAEAAAAAATAAAAVLGLPDQGHPPGRHASALALIGCCTLGVQDPKFVDSETVPPSLPGSLSRACQPVCSQSESNLVGENELGLRTILRNSDMVPVLHYNDSDDWTDVTA